jgi:hypothetical protein
MNARRILRGLAIVLALTGWGLVVAEACVRVMDPQPLMPRYITGTAWGVRGNIPGATYRHHTPEVDVGYRINSQGMRAERDFPEAKPEGTCRVAMVGDSFFVGYELQQDETIAHRVEKALEASGLRVEVLNFAVSGFGTGEMLRTYEKRMRAFDPDAVLLQWHESDFDDNTRSGLYRLDDARLAPAADAYLPSVEVQDLLMKSWLYRVVADHSQLYSWVRERAALLVKDALLKAQQGRHPSATPAEPAQSAAGAGPDEAALLSAALLRAFRDEVAADGRELLIVDIPAPLSRVKLESSWGRLPADGVAGLPVLHAADVFAPMLSPDRKLYYERGHGHITPLAAEALGAAIARRLEPALSKRNCGASPPPVSAR